MSVCGCYRDYLTVPLEEAHECLNPQPATSYSRRDSNRTNKYEILEAVTAQEGLRHGVSPMAMRQRWGKRLSTQVARNSAIVAAFRQRVPQTTIAWYFNLSEAQIYRITRGVRSKDNPSTTRA